MSSFARMQIFVAASTASSQAAVVLATMHAPTEIDIKHEPNKTDFSATDCVLLAVDCCAMTQGLSHDRSNANTSNRIFLR